MAKMGKFDIRGMKDFEKKLKSMENPDVFVESCAKELAARLLAKVIKRTPVGDYPKGSGKKGGTLRRGWTGEKRVSASAYADSLEVKHVGNEYVIEIVNPVEYASYVEFGHRTPSHNGWVPGKFMMTISEQELQAIAPRVLEAKVKKYMEGLVK
jgi:hypothetical protein